MQPFSKVEGRAAPLPIANLDTDQLIPKQFLKTVERKGLGKGLLYDFRYDYDGKAKPDFVLNQPAYQGTSILVAGDNFGCGSSREHAPWALQQYGFRALIAPSYADIFFNNSFKNGLLPIILPEAVVDQLFKAVEATPGYQLTVDLAQQQVTAPDGSHWSFEVDAYRKESLLKGLDEIGQTLLHAQRIRDFESRRLQQHPWLAKTAPAAH